MLGSALGTHGGALCTQPARSRRYFRKPPPLTRTTPLTRTRRWGAPTDRWDAPNGPLGPPNGVFDGVLHPPTVRWCAPTALAGGTTRGPTALGLARRRWGHSSTPLGGPRRPASTALGNASKLLDGVEDDPNGVDRSPQRRWGRRGVNSTPSGKSSDAVERICRRRWGHPQRRRAASKHSPNGVGGIPQRRRAPPNAVEVH